jgi:hypothetical protein
MNSSLDEDVKKDLEAINSENPLLGQPKIQDPSLACSEFQP